MGFGVNRTRRNLFLRNSDNMSSLKQRDLVWNTLWLSSILLHLRGFHNQVTKTRPVFFSSFYMGIKLN